MLNYSGCSDFVLESLMNEANEKLHSNKLKITSEKIKIKHSEDLLNYFNQSLREQNNEFNIFADEGIRLEKEISKYTKNFYSEQKNINQSTRLKRNNLKRLKRNNLKRKVSDNEDAVLHKVPSKNYNMEIITEGKTLIGRDSEMFGNSSNVEDGISARHIEGNGTTKSSLPLEEITVARINLTFPKGVTVSSISPKYDFGIFIGGTNGFLMKYSNNKEHIYQPKVKGAIKQIKIIFRGIKPILIASTDTYVFIFDNIMGKTYVKKLYFPGINLIFYNGTFLYVTMKSGIIQIINKTNWHINDYNEKDYSKNGIFYPCSINSKYSLVALKNKLLYKTENKNFTNLQIVKGIQGFQSILKVEIFGYICYSENVIHFLNHECEITGQMSFEHRLKKVTCTPNHAVVVDSFNFVHIFTLLSKGAFGEKVFEKQMDNVIIAMAVKDDTVCLAVGRSPKIFTISPFCTLPEEDSLEKKNKYLNPTCDFNNDQSSDTVNTQNVNLSTPDAEKITEDLNITEEDPEDTEVEERLSPGSTGDVIPDRPTLSAEEMSLKAMNFTIPNDESVTAIFASIEFGIFLGGANGFLMKYFNNERHVYDSGITDRVMKIEIMMIGMKPTLVAFTKKHICVYEDITSQECSLKKIVAGMDVVHAQGSMIFITIKKGYIKVVNCENWRANDYRGGDYLNEGIFFPCSAIGKYCLVSLKNKCLYKTQNKNLSNLQMIKGVEDVRKSLKVKKIGYILYFISTLYFLNQNCELINSLSFVNNIKFVKCTFHYGIVVDRLNILHIYILLKECNFGEKIFEKQMVGIVTAMDVNDDFVYVAIHDDIYTVNLK